MTITGTLKTKFDTQKVSDRFQKREFILVIDGNTQYPQPISIQLSQDKVTLIDQYVEGQELTVSINLRGREWSDPQGIKYFNTIEAWRIEPTGTTYVTATQAVPSSSVPPKDSLSDNDTLPF